MLNITKIIGFSLLLGGCAANDAETKPAKANAKPTAPAVPDPVPSVGKPGTAGGGIIPSVSPADAEDEPADVAANVSGAFLVALSCDVVNASDTAATQTTFGCSLKDEHGLNATGKVEPQSAKVAAKGTNEVAEASISQQPAGSSYQFAFVADGIRPGAAASLAFKVLYDGAVREFIYLVPASYLTKTTGDMDLHVDGAGGNDSGLCAAADPCKSIGRAVSLVPDQIAHKVVIHVLPTATYEELVIVGNRGVVNGSLEIRGEAGAAGERVKTSRPNGVFEFRNLRSPPGGIRLTGLDVEMSSAGGGFDAHSFSAAILVADSSVDLSDVNLVGPSAVSTSLHTPNFDLASAEGKELAEVAGYGLHVKDGGGVRLRRKVTVAQFATCIRISGSGLEIQADTELSTCLYGLTGSAGAKLTASRATDDELAGAAESFSLKIDRAANGIFLIDGASFAQYTAGLESIEVKRGAITPLNSFGMNVTDGAGFLSKGGGGGRKLLVKDFEYGVALASNASFSWIEDASNASVTISGCLDACVHAKGSTFRARTGAIAIAAANRDGAELLKLFDSATVELTYATSMSLTASTVGTPYAVTALDRALLSITGSVSAAPFTLPAAKLYVTNASVVKSSRPGQGSKGTAAQVGSICDVTAWDYTGSPAVSGCIDID